jgi:hypothetical protein
VDDPFLLAHIVRPFFFDIGGKLSPVSIRDQMIRGRMIVDRAYERGIITGASATSRSGYDGDEDPFAAGGELLVVGAGAAGVTAALRAAGHGIKTTLIEFEFAPFLRQASCQSRWIDPTQYDWPANHWGIGQYHWKPPAIPLHWNAGRSHAVAAAWHVLFNRARRAPPSGMLTFLPGTSASNFQFPGSPRVFVDLASRLTNRVRQNVPFNMVVSCVGFGTERSFVGLYSGYRFWDTDKFEQPKLGISPPPSQVRVLISGGGDGALQDFLRIVTDRCSAKDIYQSLPIAAQSRIQEAVYSAEDQAQRAYSWGDNDRHDHVVYAALHSSHESAIDELWNNKPLSSQIHQALDNIIRADVINRRLQVTLVHRCEHFSNCYGLNRFLVLLVGRHLRDKHSIQSFRPRTVVTKVDGVSHTCNNDPPVCHGQEHKVSLGESYCWTKAGRENALGAANFEVVVIRHGIEPPLFTFVRSSASRQSNPRQILPYHAAS